MKLKDNHKLMNKKDHTTTTIIKNININLKNHIINQNMVLNMINKRLHLIHKFHNFHKN